MRNRKNPDVDGSAYFAPEALDRVEKMSKANLSRSVLVYLTPAEFLAMAEPGYEAQKTQGVANALRAGTLFEDVPFLVVESDRTSGVARTTGHEGRHRIRALQALGVERIPVLLWTGIRWSEQTYPDTFDYIQVLPRILISEDGTKQMPFPLPVHYPKVHARIIGEAKANPRVRRNGRRGSGSELPRTVTQVTNAARIALNDPTIEFVRRKDRGLSYFFVLYGKHGMTEAMHHEPLWSNSLDEWVEKVRRAIEKAESDSVRGYGKKGLSIEILTSARKNTAKYRRNPRYSLEDLNALPVDSILVLNATDYVGADAAWLRTGTRKTDWLRLVPNGDNWIVSQDSAQYGKEFQKIARFAEQGRSFSVERGVVLR